MEDPAQPAQRVPLWAVLCATLGALLVLLSGGVLVTGKALRARYEGAVEQRDLFGAINPEPSYRGAELTGPLNVLLVGVDTRPSRPTERPLADTVMIAHFNPGLDRGYLFSLPRDTLVDIPAFEEAGFRGGHDRLNAAMSYGAAQVGDEELPNLERGFALLARTVSDLTGIEKFDAGAIINFTGFQDVVDAMGGVTLKLDERIASEHREPDGMHREANPYGEGYLGPQMVYAPGVPPCGEEDEDGSFVCELVGWQALDVVRQRKTLKDGDYGRQRNQQRFIKAMVDQAFGQDVVTDPLALDRVLRAAGASLIFSGRGRSVVDFAFALKNIRSRTMTMIRMPGHPVTVNGGYQGEELDPLAYDLFAAVGEERIDEFLLADPELISS